MSVRSPGEAGDPDFYVGTLITPKIYTRGGLAGEQDEVDPSSCLRVGTGSPSFLCIRCAERDHCHEAQQRRERFANMLPPRT